MIQVKRVYDPPAPEDGMRFLVEHLWPRGLRKAELPLDGWVKAVAPSTALRRWFGHHPARWEPFQQRYFAELDQHPAAWQPLVAKARQQTITLLYSARDRERNSAVALKRYLEQKLKEQSG